MDEMENEADDKIFFESMYHKEKVNSDLFYRKEDYLSRLKTLKFLEDEAREVIKERELLKIEKNNFLELEKKFNYKNYAFQKLIQFSILKTGMNKDDFLSEFEKFKNKENA